MSETKLNTYLNSMYQEAQLTTLVKSLEAISSEGDAYSKSIASNALTLYKALEQFTMDNVPAAAASKPRKAKRTAAKAKRTTAKAKRTAAKGKRTTVTVKRTYTTKAKPTDDTAKAVPVTPDKVVEVVSASDNGAAPSVSVESSQRLKDFRERESLSQKNAAARAEVSISSWQAWETGKWVPGEEMMRRLEKVGI